jgi:hypothetical protein
VEGYRDIYVSFIDDRLYFYYYNDSNKIVDVDIRLIKSNSNEVIFEENLGDMFKYYFDRYGNYLGYHVMELGDNHQAIILNGNGQCKSYFSYNSTIDDKCFGDNPKNLLSRYPFLSNVLVDLAEPLIFKKAITPLEIFNDISLQIAERQREEVAAQALTETWLAVANALHSFSQSMKRTYSSYNSTNNTPTYTYNNNSYLSSYSSSSRKQNAYSTTVNSYVPSLSNFNKYSFENSPYNYENSPYNYNNSSYNYKNTKYNYKNSEYNYANSIYNYKNSENNYKNNSYNYENSPYNYKNSYFNPNRTSIVNDDGNSVGYAVPKAGGGYNLFDNNGKRIGFSTGEGRGVFNSKGENSGYLVPKKNGGANIFFNEDKSKH